MSGHLVERDGMPALEFNGEELAHVSTRTATKRRWTELRLFRTAGGKYVTAVVGDSTVDGEDRICSGAVHESASDAVVSFANRRGAQGRISGPAIELLVEAGRLDPAVAEALESIEGSTVAVD